MLLCSHLAELITTKGISRLKAANRQNVLECSGRFWWVLALDHSHLIYCSSLDNGNSQHKEGT